MLSHLSAITDPNNDLLGIVIFYFDFTIFCLIGIAIFNRIANAKAVKLWPKLAPVINGKFHKGIGLRAPYIVGEYHGMPVRAWVLVTSKSRWNFVYYFQILVTTDRHDANWELHYNQRPGREQRWEISSKDPALQQHLSQSGLLGIIPGWDHDALIQYNGRKGTLLYRHHIFTRDGLPTPDVFEMQLGMLKKVATINSRANQGSDSIIQYNQQ